MTEADLMRKYYFAMNSNGKRRGEIGDFSKINYNVNSVDRSISLKEPASPKKPNDGAYKNLAILTESISNFQFILDTSSYRTPK